MNFETEYNSDLWVYSKAKRDNSTVKFSSIRGVTIVYTKYRI